MKVLLDACIGRSALRALREAGHDVARIDEPRMTDVAALARAVAESRVLITEDKDFGMLVFLHGRPSPGVVRLAGFPARDQGKVIHSVLAHHSAELAVGALVVVSDRGVRVRRPGA